MIVHTDCARVDRKSYKEEHGLKRRLSVFPGVPSPSWVQERSGPASPMWRGPDCLLYAMGSKLFQQPPTLALPGLKADFKLFV
ncbi:hypothetical protein ABBQ38_008149 [Trebouxia sp. C0009 RCD-2024]